MGAGNPDNRRSVVRTILLVSLGFATLASAVIAILPVESVPDPPFFATGNVSVIAHRGGRGLWPENTLYAFRRAAKMGVDVLEMDVRGTADGALVVIHGAEVVDTTDGRGLVEEMTLEQIGELDAGYHWSRDDGKTFPFRGKGIQVPALEAVFEALPDERLNIEIKPPSAEVAESLCRAIRRFGREENVLVASFHQTAMDRFRTQCPEVATAATPAEGFAFYRLHKVYLGKLHHPRAQVFQIPARLGRLEVVTPRLMSETKRRNLRVQVWTTNDIEEMKRLLALGVDGIMTDYPDRLLDLLGRTPAL